MPVHSSRSYQKLIEQTKPFKELIQNVFFGTFIGNTDAIVTNIQYDSREVQKNSLFVALPGNKEDGHHYISDAIKKGATAIVCAPSYKFTEEELAIVGVLQVNPLYIRTTLAEISEVFFDYPNSEMKIIGVTGTDGKSTTIDFIYQLLQGLDVRAGLLSTVSFSDGKTIISNPLRQSTPESPKLFEALFAMKNNGCNVAILETTSHGLNEENARTFGLIFDIGVVTNIGREHLDFHKTIDNYVHDKAILFRKLRPFGAGIISNKIKPEFIDIFRANIKQTGAQFLTYSIGDAQANYYIKNFSNNLRKIEGIARFSGNRLDDPAECPFFINCMGEYNAENALAAIAAVHQLGYDFERIVRNTPKIHPPVGRMQIVRNDLPILPIVDFAHTPDSFEKILPMIKSYTKGRLIVVFGSAGERDTQKRSLQGSIAHKYANIIILTNEDPREEDEMAILNDIYAGCKTRKVNKNIFLIPDRKKAIFHAVRIAKNNDTILFLGKGHEKNIICKDKTIPWNEKQIVNEAINAVLHLSEWYEENITM